LQKHPKSVGYMDTVLLPTIGNAVNVQSADIGKPDIYCRKNQVSRQTILVIIGHPDKKNCCQPYLKFDADIYLPYQ
jgi:hypothetical protein